jgi:CTP:molybdopterin cytidylyltransferase MocA
VKQAGLVLAAGAGSRFGAEPKLLANLGGRPLLEYAVAAPCAVAELERVVVVLGARAEEILAVVDFKRAEPVVCGRWMEGMAASLRCGADALVGCERVIVTLGDEPLMRAEVIARFLDAPAGTRATYDGRPGHPVVLGREQLGALQGLSGDRGARDLIGGGPTLECGDPAPVADVDTVSDLAAVRNLLDGGGLRPPATRFPRNYGQRPPK